MPRRAVFDNGRLLRILDAQHQVISRSQAIACGLPRSTVTSWCKPKGKWQRLLPGVYLTLTGKPTPEQRLMSALLYAGPRSVITGTAALRAYRLRSPGPDVIDVLVPQAARRQSVAFVRVHRTRRLPRVHRTGAVRYAPPARAVADSAQLLTSVDDVRAVVAEAIQKQSCSLAQLGLELKEAGTRDTGRLKIALKDVRAGSRSVAENRFREHVEKSSLPAPQYNVFLRSADGIDIGEVDAWWADAGVSVEIDSQEYHFYRADWLRTEAKRSRLLKHGVFPHNIAPVRVERDWDAVYAELRSSLEKGRQRPRLPIVAFEPVA
ncbi:MAG: hypothetical protein ACRDP7_40705 [Trebonia sp.]